MRVIWLGGNVGFEECRIGCRKLGNLLRFGVASVPVGREKKG